jgi:hypothetical protein
VIPWRLKSITSPRYNRLRVIPPVLVLIAEIGIELPREVELSVVGEQATDHLECPAFDA